jgi:hypothetical protein
MKTFLAITATFLGFFGSPAFAESISGTEVVVCTVVATDSHFSFLPPQVGQTIRFDLSLSTQLLYFKSPDDSPDGMLGDLGLKKLPLSKDSVKYEGEVDGGNGAQRGTIRSRLEVTRLPDLNGQKWNARLEIASLDESGFPWSVGFTAMNCKLIEEL